ncbi:MAG: family 1 glycosylhydrolase, partial [Lachnospiraceae bacterium]
FQMAHNVLRAHGKAVQAMRAHAKQPIQIGFAPTGQISYPKSESAADIEAARKHLFACPEELDNWTWNLAWWMDPVLLGRYPDDGMRLYERFLPKILPEDLKLISEPIDFLGQNIYNGHMISAPDENSKAEAKRLGYEISSRYDGFPRTAVKWPVTYECLYWGPRFLSERYGKLPIYITENGMSCTDVISLDGKVHDPNRIDFLARYIGRLRDAANDGVDVRGYFQWSFTDNFEWSEGYNERFGIVYVDYPTQRRIPKDSAFWYRNVIGSNGEILT